ncbi:MAG: hypothetical protein HQK86_02895 [Nitrospinae bacterium]|nr:hypothetical protein [Nitrospinota bacterium]MBF0633665.1 hypothetical protein [Nitrospinota bacterium]
MTTSVTAAVEGATDEAVVFALCENLGLHLGASYVTNGKDRLDKNIKGYNNAARHSPWLVLRDLDHDAECAPLLVKNLLPNPSRYMRFRLAVREVECRLMADIENFADYMGISKSILSDNPEDLDDPKAFLINAAMKSKKRKIREDVPPRANSGARVGPGYGSVISEFAQKYWRPEKAAKKSDSLKRCIKRLRELKRKISL